MSDTTTWPGMQFGIFTVSDITEDPTTGKTPSEAEKIRNAVTVARHAEFVMELAGRGHLGRLLLSHDAGCYKIGEPGGAPESFRGYDTVSIALVPDLIGRGMKDDEIRTLLVDNPRLLLAG